VHAVLEARDARLERLQREAEALAERVMEKERRLQEALARLGEAGDTDAPGAIGALSRRLEEIHGQARRQATRIRMKALQDAVQMAERVTELTRLRDELGTKVSDVARSWTPFAGAEPDGEEVEGPAADGPAAVGGIYRGRVRVEIGPVRDFAQLSRIEDAAEAIGGASDVKVERFSGGRVTLAMTLEDPVQLLSELRHRVPFPLAIGRASSGYLGLDIVEADAQADRAA
jgi:hypothetical protein